MRKHLLGIDHAVIAVNDLDLASADFTRLGFTLTPRGYHTMGSENHCLMFEKDYLELLTVARPHPVTRYFSDFLLHGDGASAMVVATDDADGLYTEWQAAGVPAEAPVAFSRPVDLADGVRDASFRITQVDLGFTPGGRVFACQHLTREVVWLPEYMTHPNSVTALKGLTLTIADAERDAVVAQYERLLNGAATLIDDDNYCIESGSFRFFITVSDASQPGRRASPCFSEITFALTAPEALIACLEKAQVDFTRRENGDVIVDSSISHGVTLIFEKA